MTDSTRQAFQKIIDFCSAGWREADQAPGLTDDMKNDQKQAYNAVFHFARDLMDGKP
jgi:hypothetical protein